MIEEKMDRSNFSSLATGVVIGATLSVLLSFLCNRRSRREDDSDKKKESLLERLEGCRGLGSRQIWSMDRKFGDCVYFDYNASTPVYPEVTLALMPYVTTCFGNPSSPHVYSYPCRESVEKARSYVAEMIGASPDTIYFTSCGTECDNRCIDIALNHFEKLHGKDEVPNVVTCSIEHPAILIYLRQLQEKGLLTVTQVGVDHEGFVNPKELEAALSTTTALVTIMHSNNEVGTIQPIRDIAKRIANFNAANHVEVLFHSDGAQSIGKVPVDVCALGVDMFSVVGHKFGAPKGVAALYIRKNVKCCSILTGGGQERGVRSGTENVPLIVALGEASRVAKLEAEDMLLHLLNLKLQLVEELLSEIEMKKPGILRFNGPSRSTTPSEMRSELTTLRMILKDHRSRQGHSTILVDQLPNTVSVSFKGTCSAELMKYLADKVACSAGSACHSKSGTLSGVLAAMHADPAYGLCTLRLSFGRHTQSEEVAAAVSAIAAGVRKAALSA